MKIRVKPTNMFGMIHILLLFTIAFYIPVRMSQDLNGMFLCGFAAMLVTVMVYAKNYDNNIAYLLFVASCFLFMQGMYFVNILTFGKIDTGFSTDISVHILDCIMLSFIFLNVGYSLGNSIQREVNTLELVDKKDTAYIKKIRRISLFMSRISLVLYFADLIDIIIFVKRNSYLDYYLNYSTHLPRILQVIGHMYIAFIWIYFATCPPKKDCKYQVLFYLIVSCLIVATGDRGGFIQNIGILLVYAFWRQSKEKETWIKKEYVFLGLIILPFFLAFMSYFVFLREGVDVGDANVLAQLSRFVSRTGNSAGVIGYGKIYHSQFPKSNYTIGGLLDYFIYNPITQVFGVVRPKAQTPEFALNMHSFESALSYFVFPNSYANGHGIGSSYIAEAYHDYSYAGVIVFNIIYGIVLSKCNNFKSDNPLRFAVLLLIIRAMYYAPRGPALVPITSIMNITIISAFILTYILSKCKL